MILRILAILIVAAASLIPSKVSYADDVQTTNTRPMPLDVVFFDTPVGNEDGIYDDKCPGFTRTGERDERIKHRVFFDQDGSVFWDGEKVDSGSFDDKLNSDLVADGLTELHILPIKNAPVGVVVSTFKQIVARKFPCVGFFDLQVYQKIWRSKSPQTAPWPPIAIDITTLPEPKKTIPLIVIQITSTDNSGREFHDIRFEGASRSGQCRAFLGDKPVSSDELYDLADKAMWNAINEAGGIDQFAAAGGDKELKELIDVIVLTTANTPWRCIGGSLSNLQRIGFLSIGFALMPESQ